MSGGDHETQNPVGTRGARPFGKGQESELRVVLDNDMTSFFVGDEEIVVDEANGYYDVEPLYKLLFPKADVEWC